MSTMKAFIVETPGGVENMIYKDIPKPKAGKDSVLIKNHYVGVNYIDTYHRRGIYPLPTPFTLGRESAGEVTEVGEDVTDFKVGDKVICLGAEAYAEYSVAKASMVEKIKNDVSYEKAATLGVQGLTAWTIVRDAYPVKKGDFILVHAAAGGVGLLLCQMCKYLGATVIGTVSSEEKAAIARQHGASYVINYSHEDVVEKVKEITGGLGCHGVLDGVGKETFDTSIACARRLGSVISFGNASGVVPPISITEKLAPKNLKLMRPVLFNYLTTREESKKWWGELFDLIDKDVLKFNIHKVYSLEDAKQAHIDIESRKTSGKLLIKVSE
ncbi:uncharacterized protein BYT42DRAFT_582815 [Radiomyces spectabilis]|uniref:uncharacterized protein n=1 Tax=Radiomyces spectabilis TaxID=64574 RepID=UPI0022202200|nr:uncharacterized protein BYT42DRAFT_582815 [Radiomyces spectabilis]KAI8370552.1 hypothetical protein BYT42DRAFT_582815 [Radiomyces spectabilis]